MKSTGEDPPPELCKRSRLSRDPSFRVDSNVEGVPGALPLDAAGT